MVLLIKTTVKISRIWFKRKFSNTSAHETWKRADIWM